MTLSDLVVSYRTSHDLSQRQFAKLCGLSNGYISMVEKNLNPKTGCPLIPSIIALDKIASAMGISLTELFTCVDDLPLDLTPTSPSTGDGSSPLSPTEEQLLASFRALNAEGQEQVVRYAADLVATGRYKKAGQLGVDTKEA